MWQLLTGLLLIWATTTEDRPMAAVEWCMEWKKKGNAAKGHLLRARQYNRDGQLKQEHDYVRNHVRHLEYDTTGTLTRERGQVADQFRYEIRYDSALVLRTEFDQKTEEVRKVYHFYDAAGRLYDERHYKNDKVHLHISYKHDPERGWLNEILYHRMPWTDEVIVKRTRLNYDNQTGQLRSKYEYDYEGLLVEETYLEYQYGTRLAAKKVITHHNAEQVHYEEKYTAFGKPEETIHDIPHRNQRTQTKFSYDSDHRLVRITQTILQDDLPQRITVTHHRYTPEGKPLEVSTETKALDGSRIAHRTLTYDTYGNPKSEVIEGADGRTQIDYMYIYFQ
ncbi:MAG: hypothetical protein ACFCUI_05185 [Bernardetiaceae bacterium]